MGSTIENIIKESKSRESAIASFNANNVGGNKLDESLFYRKLEARFPIAGAKYSSGSSGSGTGGFGNFFGDLLNTVNNGVKVGAESAGKLIESQFGKDEPQNAPGAVVDAFAKGGLNPVEILESGVGAGFDALIDQLKTEAELFSTINSEVGISGELSQGLQSDMIAASVEASKYGVSLKQIGELYTGMSEKSGKFALINKKLIDDAVPVATALGKTMAQLAETISEFEKVGLGADRTIKQISQSNTNSIGLGLNAKKIATDIQTNIGKLNEYGFQNGYKGLERMVQKATEFRMEMSSVTAIADKVFSPEGAIDLAANLQVLGGAIGDFNDPLKLMYEATNNVEGLQDALIGAASGLATYNQEQGRFEITGVNLRKAKEMAGALGITMGELNKTAIAAAERSSATAALMGRGFDIPEKDKEFLINMARMDGGEMKIVVPESLMDKFQGKQEIALDSITEEQTKALQDYQKKLESMDSKGIAMAQLTETQQMARGIDVMATYYKASAAAIGRGTARGIAEDKFNDFRKAIAKYDEKLDTKNLQNAEINAKNKTTAFLNNPLETTWNYVKEKGKEMLGIGEKKNNETNPAPITTNSNVTVLLKAEGTFTDSFNRELARDSSLAMKWADAAPNSLTTPNSAIRK
jgi:hypothetical protein